MYSTLEIRDLQDWELKSLGWRHAYSTPYNWQLIKANAISHARIQNWYERRETHKSQPCILHTPNLKTELQDGDLTNVNTESMHTTLLRTQN